MLITKSLFVDYRQFPKLAWWKVNDIDTYKKIRKIETEEKQEEIIELGASVEAVVQEYLERKHKVQALNLFPDEPTSELENDKEWDDSWVYEKKNNYENSIYTVVENTLRAIAEQKQLLYQPSFLWDNNFVRADFMVLNQQWRYDLIEVKAKSGIRKDVTDDGEKKKIGEVDGKFIDDVSFQTYVINSFLKQNDLPPLWNKYIYYLNKEYIKRGDLDISQLVTWDELDTSSTVNIVQRWKDTEKVREDYLLDRATIEWTIKDMKTQLGLPIEKFNSVHSFPWNKYVEYFGEDKPFGTVMAIPWLHHSKAWIVADLYEEGVHNLDELNYEEIERFYSKSWPGSAGTFINYYLDCLENNRPIIDEEAIKKEFDALTYPLCFYDYESVSVPIPFMDNSYPYQQVVVQYSLHKYYEDGTMKHYGWILWGLENSKGLEEIEIQNNPNKVSHESEKIIYGSYKDLLDEFLVDIWEDLWKSSFIVWHKWFENARNKEVAKLFYDISDWYLAINDKTFDLKEVFSKKHYFDLAFKGSASIKKVLPVLVPEMSYDNLTIGKWDIAMKALADVLQWKLEWDKKRQTLEDLLLYCGQDSLAMVKIYEFLQSVLYW